MPNGLQVFGADGSLQVDTGTNMTRVVGTIDRSDAHIQNGYTTIPWPYPSVSGRRVVSIVSKYPLSPGENSTAWAYYDNNTGNVLFDRGDDTGPITLVFFVY